LSYFGKVFVLDADLLLHKEIKESNYYVKESIVGSLQQQTSGLLKAQLVYRIIVDKWY